MASKWGGWVLGTAWVCACLQTGVPSKEGVLACLRACVCRNRERDSARVGFLSDFCFFVCGLSSVEGASQLIDRGSHFTPQLQSRKTAEGLSSWIHHRSHETACNERQATNRESKRDKSTQTC